MMMMKRKPNPGPKVEPDPYDPASRKIQPFMPGQQGLLSSQLNAGFGGGEQQYMGLLDQWTAPMTLPKPFNYGGQGNGNGNGNNGPVRRGDLTDAQQQAAMPWLRSSGMYGNPQFDGAWGALDPQVREFIRRKMGG